MGLRASTAKEEARAETDLVIGPRPFNIQPQRLRADDEQLVRVNSPSHGQSLTNSPHSFETLLDDLPPALRYLDKLIAAFTGLACADRPGCNVAEQDVRQVQTFPAIYVQLDCLEPRLVLLNPLRQLHKIGRAHF